MEVDFVPTIFCHTPAAKKTPQVLQQKLVRQNRVKVREENKNKTSAALALMELSKHKENVVPGIATQTSVETREIGIQTDLDSLTIDSINMLTDKQCHVIEQYQDDFTTLLNQNNMLQQQFDSCVDRMNSLQIQVQSLENEITSLQAKVLTCLSNDFIKCNDDRTSYFTGLPNYSTFLVVFEHARRHITRKNTKLDLKDELLLTLVKLKQNPGTGDLAYRFGVSQPLISTIFHAWLHALYKSIGGLVIWPPNDKEMQLPDVFNNHDFRKVKCIIDCTEIFIERPTALKARCQTYSSYKRHNTLKVLIGISPSGSVIFLSEIWGGRASDKKITTESGIMDKFLPGDVVMADRGFVMKEEFAQRGVKLIMPAFTKGKLQLSPAEVEISRRMSRARIHVERVIGRMKDFKIFSGTMPISFVKKRGTCKKVLHVTGGIVNTNNPLL